MASPFTDMSSHTDFIIHMNELFEHMQNIRNPEKNILSEIFDIVIELIQLASKINNYSGKRKKELVIRVIFECIKKENETMLEVFDTIILPMISNAIDDFIRVHKDGLKLETVECGCFPRFPILSYRKKAKRTE